jgi:hypothetical protein
MNVLGMLTEFYLVFAKLAVYKEVVVGETKSGRFEIGLFIV